MASPEDFSVEDLKEIARMGGGFDVDATGYLVSDLKTIAQFAGAEPRARVNVRKAQALTVEEMKEIARYGQGVVWFDI